MTTLQDKLDAFFESKELSAFTHESASIVLSRMAVEAGESWVEPLMSTHLGCLVCVWSRFNRTAVVTFTPLATPSTVTLIDLGAGNVRRLNFTYELYTGALQRWLHGGALRRSPLA